MVRAGKSGRAVQVNMKLALGGNSTMKLYLKTQSSPFKSAAYSVAPGVRDYVPASSQVDPVGQAESWTPQGRILPRQRNLR